MAERLGEMLLQEGTLTATQLEEALSAQSIYGGRIGTNLLEMGLVSEEELGRLLNQKLGVPCVTAASLESVPASVIEALPAELARRFRVVPVAQEGRKLSVAMADPADFHAVEELGFATGLVIVPRVCPELRLSVALEHYYGIKRALRYIPMPEGARTTATRKTLASLAGTGPAPGASPVAQRAVVPPGNGDDQLQSDSGAVQGEAGPVLAGKNAFLDGGAASARRHGIEAVMDALSRRFVAATGEVDVVTALMSYLAEEFDRAGFFSLKCGAAQGVQAVADGANVNQFGGWLANLDRADLVKQVLLEKEPYLGMLPAGGTEERIQSKIGGSAGSPVLLLPLVVEGTSVAFLMVEDERGRLAPGLFDLRRVVAKAELAFEMLGLKKRICIV
ncbi:general secretion pathway protein GspE [Geomonas silvestris]|uniref:General secretion pathway protein GspE n=1 Tax=Geomonas silvestris TaxID=2740184 RepID=A0A6V8MFB3_9BACT|nr:general secretion pathway protein GspE [Geomonas silvestris]GFO58685.1 general secretion pathway protein GspE [Geomonas silvestris]